MEVMGISNEVIIAILAASVLLIKTAADVLARWFTKELGFKQQQRHNKLKIRQDLELEDLKQQHSRQQQIAQNELENKLSRNITNDIVNIQHILKQLREVLNANNVAIALFHNGVAKGFRNYSIRYEECRTLNDSVMNELQSKPLGGLYTALKEFETAELLHVKKTDELNSINKEALNYIKLCNIDEIIIVPLMVTDTDNPVVPVNLDGETYYIIGLVVVSLDSKSKEYTEQINKSILNRVDDIINIYNKNPKVFG